MRLFIHPRFPELCICLAEHGWGDQGTSGAMLERVPVCSQTQTNRGISMNHHDRRPPYHIENREKKPILPGRRELRKWAGIKGQSELAHGAGEKLATICNDC